MQKEDAVMGKAIRIGSGCSVELGRSGYEIVFRRDGKKKRKSLYTDDKTIAIGKAYEQYGRWQRELYDPWKAHAESATVEDALKHYIRVRGKEIKYAKENTNYVRTICEESRIRYIGDLSAHDLRRAIYDKSLEESTQYSKYTKLHAILNWLTKAGYFEQNPMKEVQKPKKPQRTPKYYDEEQLGKFFNAAPLLYDLNKKYTRRLAYPLWYVDALHLVLLTGLRKSEAVRLTWGDIRFPSGDNLSPKPRDIGAIEVQASKNKKTRTVTMQQDAWALLERLERDTRISDNPYEPVLKNSTGYEPISGDYLSRKFNKVRELAKLPAIGLHGLRHSFAARLVRRGKPIEAIRQELGHDDITTTQVYAQLGVTERMRMVYEE